uniref:FANCI_HD2 domain-containing protein n=1 Tax=Strongyloides venezuelensis TaxID=75913 RepID=A0A0K0FSJ6_STRVS
MAVPSQSSKYEAWLKHFVENVNNLSHEYCGNLENDENYDVERYNECLSNVLKSYDRADFAARYEALYNYFLECSKNDGGKIFCRFLKRFIYALDHIENKGEHAYAMTKHMLDSLHLYELNAVFIRVLLALLEDIINYVSYPNLVNLADLINAKIIKSKTGSELPEHFLVGSTYILRKIYMFSELSSGTTDDRSGVEFIQQFFLNLLDGTDSSKACDAFRLASCFNIPEIYKLYIESVFSSAFEYFTSSERAAFLQKCFNFLEDMNEKDVHMLFGKYFDVWGNLTSDEVMEIKPVFVEFFEHISRDEVTTLRLLSMIKSTMTSIMYSNFGFIVAMTLCSSKKLSTKAIKDIGDIFIRLWKSSFELDNNAWLIHIVGTSPVTTWKEKFEVLFKVIRADEELKSSFLPGMEELCLSLLSYRAKEGNQGSKNGVIHDGDSVAHLGSWVFLDVIDFDQVTFSRCIDRLLRFIKGSFGDSDTCLFYIDVLVSVVKKYKEKLSECWSTISSFIENVFKVPNSDLCCTVIRSLLPIIMDHVELRKLVLNEVKTCIKQTTTQEKVIPIVFYLLRAVTGQSDVMEMNNYSQSFATYGSLSLMNGYKRTPDEVIAVELYAIIRQSLNKGAVTKSILYKGLVDNCTRNSNIIPHSIALLLDEMCNVEKVSIDDLVALDKGVLIINKPLPQLMATITRIVKLSVLRGIENKTMENNSFALERKIDLIINQMKEKTLEDFGLSDDLCTSVSNAEGARKLVFAKLMLQMYDISLEYVWNFGDVLNNQESSGSFFNLLTRRVELENIISKVKKANIKGKNSNFTSSFDKLSPVELDDKVLSTMLNTIVTSKEEEDAPVVLSEENRVVLARFVVQSFHEKIKNIDAFNIHGAISMKILTTIATSLYHVYFMKDGSSFATVPVADNIRTLALEAFVNIIIYITKKYEDGSEPTLTIIFKDILAFHGVNEEQMRKISEDDKYINIVGSYYCFLMQNDLYSVIAQEDEFSDSPKELLRRGEALLKLFNHIADTIPNAFCSVKKRFLLDACKSTMKVYSKGSVPQIVGIANELWTLVFKLVYTSQIYTNVSISRMLTTIVDTFVAVYSSSRNENDEDYQKRSLKSITHGNVNNIFSMHVKAIQKMIHNFETSTHIYLNLYPELTDDFLTLLFTDCDVVVKYAHDIVEISADFNCNKNTVAEMLTILYKSLTSIVNQFVSKSGQKKEMLGWGCLDKILTLLKDNLYNIFKVCKDGYFKEDDILDSGKITNNMVKKLKADYKKNDTILHNYNLAIKYFEIAIFNLNVKVGGNRFNLDESAMQLSVNETSVNVNETEC